MEGVTHMKRFNIPEIGTRFLLAEDWTFDLYHEYRNWSLFEILGINHAHSGDWRTEQNPAPHKITLPKGTMLTIDRVYIRKGAKEFSSVTFNLPKRTTSKKTVTRTATYIGGPDDGKTISWDATKPARGVRFWAKLADVNKMVVEEELQ